MPTPKLLPCPLCGGKMQVATVDYVCGWFYSSCDTCHTSIGVEATSLADAIRKLNRRPEDG